jgi:hypothetical protein
MRGVAQRFTRRNQCERVAARPIVGFTARRDRRDVQAAHLCGDP